MLPRPSAQPALPWRALLVSSVLVGAAIVGILRSPLADGEATSSLHALLLSTFGTSVTSIDPAAAATRAHAQHTLSDTACREHLRAKELRERAMFYPAASLAAADSNKTGAVVAVTGAAADAAPTFSLHNSSFATLLEVTPEDLAQFENPYEHQPADQPSPAKNCTKPYCSLRYAPRPRDYTLVERREQWALVQQKYGLRIVHANDKARAASRAYVTMVTTADPNYAMGALVLAQSLRNQNTTYPIVALVSDNGQALFGLDSMGAGGGGAPVDEAALAWRRALLEEFDMVVRVPTMQGGPNPNLLEKLFMLSLVMFDRIAWLGSDTVTVLNVDPMLDCRPPCGVYDEHLWQMDAIAVIVNGDVVVVQPDLKDLAKLLFIVSPENEGANHDNPYIYSELPPYNWFGPADQGVLNTYYRRHWTVLPKGYQKEMGANHNAMVETHVFQPGFTRLVHFAAASKPWTHRSEVSTAWWCPVRHQVAKAYGLNHAGSQCPPPAPQALEDTVEAAGAAGAGAKAEAEAKAEASDSAPEQEKRKKKKKRKTKDDE